MSDETKPDTDADAPPTPRYLIQFEGHAQTWDGLIDVVRQMVEKIRRRPGPQNIVSGGGWDVSVTEPDPTQTPDRYNDELCQWLKRQRVARREAANG